MAGIMTDIKGDGHSLVAPRWTVGWGAFAILAIFLLAVMAGIGLWLYGKVKSVAGGKTTTEKSAALSDQAGMGSMGIGYL